MIPMCLSSAAVQTPLRRYRLPALLQDIQLLDLLELSGSTVAASRLVGLSQPSVSRRYRALATDFDLPIERRSGRGCRYGCTPTLRHLRMACRCHRLSTGVVRLGADLLLQPLLSEADWLLPAPPRFRRIDEWLELIRQAVIDGAVLSGLELAAAGRRPGAGGLDWLHLGEVPLALAVSRHWMPAVAKVCPSVLLPPESVAAGLRLACQQRGLRLSTAAGSCHDRADWLARLDRQLLAMALPAGAPAGWWQGLTRLPWFQPLQLPVWLVLPVGWRRLPVLQAAAAQLKELSGHPGHAEHLTGVASALPAGRNSCGGIVI